MLEEYHQKLNLDEIVIEKSRQRQNLKNIPDLAAAIERTGLLHPVVVRRPGNILVTGERRTTAYKHLRDNFKGEGPNPWIAIPFRYLDTLDDTHAQLIEMEENVQREQFDWHERAEALLRIQELRGTPITATAEYLGMSESTLRNHVLVAERIRAGEAALKSCVTMGEALNKIKRQISLVTAQEVNKLLSGTRALTLEPLPPEPAAPLAEGEVAPPPPSAVPTFAYSIDRPIINASFFEWAEAYTGTPFNFIHCDFPYGINHQKSAQGRVDSFGAYDDREEIYWDLLRGLAKYKHKLISPSAHMIFWFSMKHYEATMAFFREHFPEFTFDDYPIIWVKRQGIAPDPKRRPQRNYETALFGWTMNRNTVQLCSNVALAPQGIKHHASQKSLDALRQLFRLVVNEYTEMLDPTAGSGMALQAASSLKAKRVVGIELDPKFAETANDLFQSASVVGYGAGTYKEMPFDEPQPE